MGLATAAGSLGQFVFAPLGQAFLTDYGWQTALLLLAGSMVVVPAARRGAKGGGRAARGRGARALPAQGGCSAGVRARQLSAARRRVLRVRVPRGVHNDALAGAHRRRRRALARRGWTRRGRRIAAWALALIGLFNIVGSYGSGVLGARHSKRQLLAGIYLSRAVVIALFITLPPTSAVVLVFAAAMGVLWLSTVPLTSGLVAVMFGTGNLGTLFGIVFFSHQVGAFLGVWLGGVAFEQTGSFMPIWWPGSPSP